MKQRITLYAEDGKVLTDGEHFGRIVYLAANADASAWHEITEKEFEILQSTMIPEEMYP